MRIEFKNNIGEIKFGREYVFAVTEIDGLGLVPRTRNMTNFSGVDGQYCLGEYTGARTITINGDFIDENNFWEKKAIRIFHSDGILTVNNKMINTVCSHFEITRKGGGYKTFILQLTADYPYFQDSVSNHISISEVTRLIKTQFAFPLVMSRRDCRSYVYNYGDTICEPIVKITAVNDTVGGTVTIENSTSGKSIAVNYKMNKGEILTVDIEKRTVTSSINGNVLYALSDDSFLSDFVMNTGKNEITVRNASGGEIVVELSFKNRYAEAV